MPGRDDHKPMAVPEVCPSQRAVLGAENIERFVRVLEELEGLGVGPQLDRHGHDIRFELVEEGIEVPQLNIGKPFMRSSRGSRFFLFRANFTRSPLNQTCLAPKHEAALTAAPTLCGNRGLTKATAGVRPSLRAFLP